jgi:hypothetical protein
MVITEKAKVKLLPILEKNPGSRLRIHIDGFG